MNFKVQSVVFSEQYSAGLWGAIKTIVKLVLFQMLDLSCGRGPLPDKSKYITRYMRDEL